MGDTTRGAGRLFGHDALLIRREAGAALAGWPDRAIAAVLLIAALAVAHRGLVDQPDGRAPWIGAMVGIVTGIGAARVVAARLAHHGADGLLAVEALDPVFCRRYRLRCHAAASALLVTILLVVRTDLIPMAAAGHAAAALVATAAATLRRGAIGLRAGLMLERRLTLWQRRAAAGVVAAGLLPIVTIATRAGGDDVRLAAPTIAALAVAAMLTRVDAAVVRFMAMAGQGLAGILRRQARAALAFLVLGPVATLSGGIWAAAMVAAAILAMLLLMALRIQAYRSHDRRQADLVVAVALGAIAFAAMLSPFAAPLVAGGLFWRMSHRATQRRWLVA